MTDSMATPGTRQRARSRSWHALGAAVFLTVLHGLDPEFAGAQEAPAASGGTAADVTIRELMATACPAREFKITAYDQATDRAAVVVSPDGSLLSDMPARFDENDTLVVTVYGDARLLPSLHVARKSAFRVVVGINILGQDVKIPAQVTGRAKDRTFAPGQPSCDSRTFLVRDFAGGRGEVEISVAVGFENLLIGSLSLNVDPVYSGMFSLGGAWTPLTDPSFSIASGEGSSTVIASESGGRRLSYVFMYTPFLWERLERDVRKGPEKPWYRVNPSVGFAVDAPLDNVVLGATVDIQSAILFTGGVYFSHVHRLDGMAIGDEVPGGMTTLPITRRWERDWFVAVSLDLRVAARLVQVAIGTSQ